MVSSKCEPCHCRCLLRETEHAERRNHPRGLVFLILAPEDSPGAQGAFQQTLHSTFKGPGTQSMELQRVMVWALLRKWPFLLSNLHAGCLLKVAMVIRLPRSFR